MTAGVSCVSFLGGGVSSFFCIYSFSVVVRAVIGGDCVVTFLGGAGTGVVL